MQQHIQFSHNRHQCGFSLIELMIVISIMGILIGIGIPAYSKMTIAANETAAIGTLKSISTNQRTFFNSKRRYAESFDEMREFGALDGRFSGDTPAVDGFTFKMTVTPRTPTAPPTYIINADPLEGGALSPSSDNHYYIDSSSESIHISEERAATATDPVIGEATAK